jgi:hypothetical protein
MSYFNLRKRAAETEPEPVEEEQPEEAEDDETEDEPDAVRGPIVTGLLGPGTWIAARFGTGTAWTAHVIAVWAIGFYGGWIAAGIVLAWLLAVLLFVPREYLDRASAWFERRDAGPDEGEPDGSEGPLLDPLAAVLWHLIADAPGVHLKTLTARLQKAAPEQSLDRAVVRAKLGALDIPVRASVRDAAGRVNEGVHRADLEVWQQALPGPSPEPAPEARSSPVATAVTCDVGDAATPVATPLATLRGLLSRGVA